MLRCVVLMLAIGCSYAVQRYMVISPDVFHVGEPERVSIAVYDVPSPVTVKVYLQDYPNRRKTFSQAQAAFAKDNPGYLTVKVDPADLPDQGSQDKQYVYLVAQCDDPKLKFKKEVKVLLSYRDGVILIQTDKPIYTPDQTVKFRVIPLGFDLKPSAKKVNVVVKNPQNIRVQQWNSMSTSTGFISETISLGSFAMLGNWTVEAFYGHGFVHNTSTQFEVREYVLPRFYVKIQRHPLKNYILRKTTHYPISISARYTYDKPVEGPVNVRLSIVGRKQESKLLMDVTTILNDGSCSLNFKPAIIKDLPDKNLWFPDGFRLQIEATVIEKATGLRESVTDNSIHFTTTPFVIKYQETAEYFRPGLPFPVKVKVTYPNGVPAVRIPMKLSAKATKRDGKEVDVGLMANAANMDQTGPEGKAEFIVDIPRDVATLRVKVRTEEKDVQPEENAVKELIARAYTSQSGDFLMVRQLRKATVGKNIICEAFLNSKDVDRLTYAIIARGKILHQDTIVREFGIVTTIRFRATAMMSPSARLIGYYISKTTGEVVTDSILLDVEDELPNKVRLRDADTGVQTFPGTDYEITVFGEPGTRVGLLAVDMSVYLLRNDNRLTKDSVYKKLEELDLGCGVGSGKDSKDVVKNAGAVMMSGTIVSDGRQNYGCEAAVERRKRRSLPILQEMNNTCCALGKEPGDKGVGCVRKLLQFDFLTDKVSPWIRPTELKQCYKTFIYCCQARYGKSDMGLLARSIDFGDFGPSDEELMENSQVRTYFPETWIYREEQIGADRQSRVFATIPDTITTWVVQAVAVSNSTGLGIAKPLHLKAFKSLFVHLTLPYSVQRGEQIQVLATVYNYHAKQLRMNLYLVGHEKFCSKVKPRARQLIERFTMKAQSSQTVSILILPKEIGLIPIQVFAVSALESDSESRNLLVVPEGVGQIKTQSFVLDPAGVLKDNQQIGERAENKNGTAFKSNRLFDIQDGKKKQIDNILLEVPKTAVPGSVGASLAFTGNLIGPVVTNLINGGLDNLLRMPTGCGEQTLIYMSPNVYVLEYLSNTHQVTASVEAKAYKFIQQGYLRELNYRRNDKSFSAWGNRHPGSTWLTAFAMKVFCKASKFDGVQIDSNLVCDSVSWLVQNQRADGAFPEVHAVIHREMVGGVYQSDVAMTAFVVTTLLECSCNNVINTAAISRGVTYLEKAIPQVNGPYVLSLTTYALALANSPKRYEANTKLANMALYNQIKSTRHWNAGGHALNIETASYALLAQMALNKLKYAGPIVVWLTEQKNSGGGFKSTTDTCVALQALAKYSEQTAGSQLDLTVSLRSEIGGLNRKITINKKNALLQQKIDMFDYLGGNIFIDTLGTGVAQMQAEVRYNVPSAKKDRCDFALSIRVTEDGTGKTLSALPQGDAAPSAMRRNGKKNKKNKKCKHGKRKNGKCRKRPKKGKGKKGKKGKKDKNEKQQKIQEVNSLRINVCTRYKKAGKTGMAIIDVGVFTGFAVDERSLKELQKKMEGSIGKYEISERSVVFYINEIRNDRDLCVAFNVTRVFEVGTVQPVPVKVYDYYEPDDACMTFYGANENSALRMGICNEEECRCLQDKCTPRDPTDGDLRSLVCKNNFYAIKAKVLLVDEDRSMLTYTVQVLEVYNAGRQKVNKGNIIELKKQGSCREPNMNKMEEYFIAGSGKGGVYSIDSSVYAARWTRQNDKKLKKLASRIDGSCAK
uniref:Complement component C3 n=1 Tax=Nematostella vectensis TaxID=45351 RepID=B9X080_NEMVE|nr:complement component C3 precursor [Nematostella vectensis]